MQVEILFRCDFVRLAERWQLERLASVVEADASEVWPDPPLGTEGRMGERAATELEAIEFAVREEQPRPGTTVLFVEGEADLHVAPDLRAHLTEAIDSGAVELIVDLSETTFVDSMTLGVLLGTMKRLREPGGRVRLVVSRPDIRRIFEITLLVGLFPLYETLEEALAAAATSDAP